MKLLREVPPEEAAMLDSLEFIDDVMLMKFELELEKRGLESLLVEARPS